VELIHLNDVGNTELTLLLLNGGGRSPFSQNHPLTNYFKQFDLNIYSVELPGHGKSCFHHLTSVTEMLESFQSDFMNLIEQYQLKKIGLVGFSLGGLLSLKSIELELLPFEFAIVLGCGVVITETQKKIIDYYTTPEFFDEMQWTQNMEIYHGTGWPIFIQSLHQWFNLDTPIFSSSTLLQKSKILFLFGDNDEVFPPAINIPSLAGNSNIHYKIIEKTTHFEYFAKSWIQTKNSLIAFEKENKWYS
jgi:pimeloyl-ACP methyl ester carboxylesterase